MTTATLVQQLRDNDGFSYSFDFGNCGGLPYYSIAMNKATEATISQDSTDEEINRFIQNYLKTNSELFTEEGVILGGWLHKGQYYIDAAQLISKETGLDYAKMIGRERDQIAIFDLETFEEIKCEEIV